ncbi:uncharacterized protein [Maniola hyperantus]|uniref:uncharacterized protein n=1 Tax=Aphantopus hyperantus TaxID=2795564 RepID=UPI0015686953|nr:uncharacterized protein LOC117991517 [Maniola hyperantus]
MADDNTIIEGTVKFRDGKKWKSRWCVMRKLSPVADCVHLQVYRDSRARCGGAASKASLSLQRYLGCEAGFTLDKHSHTLALLCQDFTAVLAFETRERLMQWQVKVSAQLGDARQYLVLLGSSGDSGARRLAAGPARLHLHERRFALTSGVPPRLLGVWEIAHLRRYGVVEGRFCFEGGSHCGKGEGLHVLVTDQAADIAREFHLASQGLLTPRRRPLGMYVSETGTQSPNSNNTFKKPHVRRLELNTIDRSLPPTDLRLYEDPCMGDEAGLVSPYWPSAERTHQFQDMGLGDTASVNETIDGTDMAPWSGNGNVMLERCMSCISKLGALSRSSTAALTPGAKPFSPAWTMEAVGETHNATVTVSSNGPLVSKKSEEVCRCAPERPGPPERPPKPVRLELNLTRKPPMPLPVRSFSHSHLASIGEHNATSIGPYDNYDVPKILSAEVEGEYYDTPKRLKECLNSELFKITKNSTSNTLILKKPCGCLLKLGKRPKRATIVDSDESFEPANCPCQRVTDWANNWIKLPYCTRNPNDAEATAPNKENVMPSSATDRNALYATVDLSRKTKRKTQNDNFMFLDNQMSRSLDSGTVEVNEGPQANYENLSFALSLEHYENAKDLLRKAGVTQPELDALGANLRPALCLAAAAGAPTCTQCGHPQDDAAATANRKLFSDEYLLMEPTSLDSNKLDQEKALPSGYTPMSPIGSFGFHTLKYPAKSTIGRLLDEKSASNPTLCGPDEARAGPVAAAQRVQLRAPHERADFRKRSSSADSSRFLDDVKEFDGSVGSRGSASSIETLRDAGAAGAPCTCAAGKLSDADSSEASKARCVTVAVGNRDSSSSNDSGVSSWSLVARGAHELPATSAAARRRYRSARRAADSPHAAPRRSRSSGGPRAEPADTHKCCSAEAEVPILSVTVKPGRGVLDTHSTSSGASDMSDYVETLSICSSHSSSDTPVTMRVLRHTTSTLRPRSGKEYQPLAPRLRCHNLS